MVLERCVAAGALMAAVLLAGCGGEDPPSRTAMGRDEAVSQSASRRPAVDADPAQALDPRLALGQMIVARFAGRTPTPALLGRIRRGEVGGVILFGDNTAMDERATTRIVRALQGAAAAGRMPRLLVLMDQEGGEVKRLPGPPAIAPAAMTTAAKARAEGARTGAYLRRIGVDVDLAPVVDVKRRADSFLGSRISGTTPAEVSRRACAFAAGLASRRVAATLKHFPGLGGAPANTDDRPATIRLPAATLRADLLPYRRCAGKPGTLVMMSSAKYPTLLGGAPAVLTPDAYSKLLGDVAAQRPVTVSDDLETPALAPQATPARRAVLAGLDLLLYAGTEGASARAYRGLLAEVRSGRVPASRVRDAAARILALKAWLAEHRSGAQPQG